MARDGFGDYYANQLHLPLNGITIRPGVLELHLNR
jgi:hypothetical protein